MNKKYLNWNEFDRMVRNLTIQIKKSRYKFDGIFGIPKGGIILSICLAHRLNLPLLLFPTKNSLVVDDISDIGKTLKHYKHKKIATLYKSLWTNSIPNYNCEMKISKNDWIVFPWEIE